MITASGWSAEQAAVFLTGDPRPEASGLVPPPGAPAEIRRMLLTKAAAVSNCFGHVSTETRPPDSTYKIVIFFVIVLGPAT